MVYGRETWRQHFSKCVRKVTLSEATHACKSEQLCVVLKVLINRDVRGFQYIWYANSTEENWGGGYLLMQKTSLIRLIKLECCGRFFMYGSLEIVFFKLLSSLIIARPVKWGRDEQYSP